MTMGLNSSASLAMAALTLIALAPSVCGIVCYRCDSLERRSPFTECPGHLRRPIDTRVDRKDLGGLYTHCVEIRLRNGSVIHQDAYPAHPTCRRDFREAWRRVLENRFRQRVLVRCCDTNLCNSAKKSYEIRNLTVISCLLWALLATSTRQTSQPIILVT